MITRDEKNKVIEGIETSFAKIIATSSLFNDQSLNKIPFEGSWTAGQVLDHITMATAGTPDGHVKEAERPYDKFAGTLETMFLDFSTKLNSPEPLKAGPGPFKMAQMLSKLENNKDLLLATADTQDLTLLCMDFEIPSMGFLTRYEWLRFIVAHTLRHDHQLKNILDALDKR